MMKNNTHSVMALFVLIVSLSVYIVIDMGCGVEVMSEETSKNFWKSISPEVIQREIADASDHDEAMNTFKYLVKKYKSEFLIENGQKFYWNVSARNIKIFVYGIVDDVKQKRIHMILKHYKMKERIKKPIVLNYYEKENFIQVSPQRKTRKNEVLLKTVIIESMPFP